MPILDVYNVREAQERLRSGRAIAELCVKEDDISHEMLNSLLRDLVEKPKKCNLVSIKTAVASTESLGLLAEFFENNTTLSYFSLELKPSRDGRAYEGVERIEETIHSWQEEYFVPGGTNCSGKTLVTRNCKSRKPPAKVDRFQSKYGPARLIEGSIDSRTYDRTNYKPYDKAFTAEFMRIVDAVQRNDTLLSCKITGADLENHQEAQARIKAKLLANQANQELKRSRQFNNTMHRLLPVVIACKLSISSSGNLQWDSQKPDPKYLYTANFCGNAGTHGASVKVHYCAHHVATAFSPRGKRFLILIHGYNSGDLISSGISDIVQTYTNVRSNVQFRLGTYYDEVIGYIWPGQNRPTRYFWGRHVTKGISKNRLRQFLDSLRALGAEQIDVIAHSMGNRLVLEALSVLPRGRVIDNYFCMGAAVGKDSLDDPASGNSIGEYFLATTCCKTIIILYSREDTAVLGGAYPISELEKALGYAGRDARYLPANAYCIDMTKVVGGHSYWDEPKVYPVLYHELWWLRREQKSTRNVTVRAIHGGGASAEPEVGQHLKPTALVTQPITVEYSQAVMRWEKLSGIIRGGLFGACVSGMSFLFLRARESKVSSRWYLFFILGNAGIGFVRTLTQCKQAHFSLQHEPCEHADSKFQVVRAGVRP